MKICTDCGYKNSDSDTKCVNCGAVLGGGGNTTNSNTANPGSAAHSGSHTVWGEGTTIFFTIVIVLAFAIIAIYLFNTFSGTTIAGVVDEILYNIREYYDSLL